MSQTGPTKRALQTRLSSRGIRGFTLIELFIVSAIILILVSFSTPLFRKTFSDLELKEAAANITSFITFAQHKAVADEAVCKITFDYENKTYRLLIASGGAPDTAAQYVIPKDRFGKLFHIPQNIEIEGQSRDIFFYPDGRCDKTEIKLMNKNKKTLKLATTGTLGNVITTQE
ncbi:MAG: prepilin-type N-terminal cleavage/methylation domain-containing protein [Candidatus Omnitrophica bacterium]|nr:prepilin-type N-terminal cleavage/methylation domain-containing protein [Candidatus Omnitrophota bacterium]